MKLQKDMDGCLYQGKPCHIQQIKTRGWVLIIDNKGSARTVRAKDIELPVAEPPPAALVGETPPATSGEAKMARKTNGNGKTRKIGEAKVDLGHYTRTKLKSGRSTFDIGDETATRLRGMDLPELYEYAAKKLDVSVRSLKDKYGSLNAGMIRMNLGNRLRGLERAKQARAESRAAA